MATRVLRQTGWRLRAMHSPRREARYASSILKIVVPQSGQTPSIAGRPFFSVICLMFVISRWALHFRQ
jgi:hypothetical protein